MLVAACLACIEHVSVPVAEISIDDLRPVDEKIRPVDGIPEDSKTSL